MKLTSYIAIAAAALSMVTSCQQMHPVARETVPMAKVKLAQNNYRVLATRVSAEDKGFTLLPGAATALNIATLGWMSHAIPAGITIKSPSDSKALKDLYAKTGACHTGRATQLINVRKEYGGLNAIIFGRPTVRYTADLIEFTR